MKPEKNLLSAVLLAGSMLCVPPMVHAQGASEQRFPEVVEARISARGDGRFDFDVTISSPYDSPQRYADAFRVLTGC